MENMNDLEQEVKEQEFNWDETADTSKVSDEQKLMEGEFECYVEKIELTQSSTNRPMIKTQFRVRDDVNQRYKRKCVFKNYLIDKDNQKNTFLKMVKACGIEGAKSLKDFAFEAQNAHIVLVVAIDKEKDEEYISFYKKSKLGAYEKPQALENDELTDADCEEFMNREVKPSALESIGELLDDDKPSQAQTEIPNEDDLPL